MSFIMELLSGSGNIGILIGAIAFLFDKGRTFWAWYSERKEAKITEIIWDAICYVSALNDVNLSKENDIGKTQGSKYLSEATEVAKDFASKRGIDLLKKYGSEAGVKAAVQNIFKQVKAGFRNKG